MGVLIVIDAGDFGVAGDDGFVDDASFAIPDDDSAQIPQGVDTAALSDLSGSDAAASDVTDEQVEDDPLATAEAEWLAEKTALEAQWRKNLQNLQSAKDREVSQFRAQYQQADAYNRALMDDYVAYLKESGHDESDIRTRMDAIYGRTNREVQQLAHEERQSEQQFQTWVNGNAEKMHRFIQQQSTGPNGERLFDPATDTELTDLTRRFFAVGREAYKTQNPTLMQQLTTLAEQHQALVLKRRDAALLAGQARQKSQSAGRQRQAREAQQQRGRQVTVAAGGAGPLTDDQLFAAARDEMVAQGVDPDRDYAKVYQRYLVKKHGG